MLTISLSPLSKWCSPFQLTSPLFLLRGTELHKRWSFAIRNQCAQTRLHLINDSGQIRTNVCRRTQSGTEIRLKTLLRVLHLLVLNLLMFLFTGVSRAHENVLLYGIWLRALFETFESARRPLLRYWVWCVKSFAKKRQSHMITEDLVNNKQKRHGHTIVFPRAITHRPEASATLAARVGTST